MEARISFRRIRTGATDVLFYEYFHGDNGAGPGASHQTGWTGVIARLMHIFATLRPEYLLKAGKKAVFTRGAEPVESQTNAVA